MSSDGEWTGDQALLETERLWLFPPAVPQARAVQAFFARNRQHLAGSGPRLPAAADSDDAAVRAAYWDDRLGAQADEVRAGTALGLWLVAREQPTAIAGGCNLTNIVRGPFQACHLGYQLDQAAVGQGLMTEALRAVIAHAWGQLGLHRIMANYRPTNERSGRLLRRLGFTVEGYARDYLFLDGAWRDHVLTALTRAG